MHTFGHPARVAELVAVCDEYEIPVVEDAAESLGSWVGERHTVTFGRLGTLSFNGNKVITTGGGGMIVTDDDDLAAKREVARRYAAFFEGRPEAFVTERAGTTTNDWLNAVRLETRGARDALLEYTNQREVMTRPIWRLMTELPMYQHCHHDGLATSRWLEERIVNLPSSLPAGWLA